MGKFLDIIQEQQPVSTRKQTLVNGFKEFFNVDLTTVQRDPDMIPLVDSLLKNPRSMIAKMLDVDPDIQLTYDKDQRKLRGDQIEGGGGFNTRQHTTDITNSESVVTEAATPESINKFLNSIEVPSISAVDAQRAADRWTEFIEFLKNDLQWNYSIQYKKPEPAAQPTPGEPTGQPAPENPTGQPDTGEKPQASKRDMLIDPDKKGLFRRGIEAAGRGLRDLGGAAKRAFQSQDPYNPNANRDAMGNLGLGSIKSKPNQGRIDSKKIEKRMKSVQAKLSNLEGEEYQKALGTFDTLRTNWGKVKPALISYPEKNGDWRNYISNQLASLEQQVGIDPDSSLAKNPQYIDITALGAGGNRQRR